MLINWSLVMVIDQGWAIILASVFAAGLGIILLKEEE
jgi:hypothetical protein